MGAVKYGSSSGVILNNLRELSYIDDIGDNQKKSMILRSFLGVLRYYDVKIPDSLLLEIDPLAYMHKTHGPSFDESGVTLIPDTEFDDILSFSVSQDFYNEGYSEVVVDSFLFNNHEHYVASLTLSFGPNSIEYVMPFIGFDRSGLGN